ncbi:PilW family protein [Myxococcus sp. K15C18031901]|uniref:PilW family protein n=1 Tax=Myxococcus dinghuensis TaxID=2906761 RepID=UPI0020A7A1F3|nr:PilW family protein [Myxococcus dinghuensis]MCP3102025.1 PilW family protein [Myxococcus dinghuensis]
MSTPRGMTLLETMIALAITSVIIAAAATLMLAGSRFIHNTEHSADSHDASRMAGEALMNAVRQAGAGAPGGLWVRLGGTPVRINTVFGRDGTTGTGTAGNVATADGSDDLWLVLPDRNYLGEPCVAQGAAASVVSPGTGALQVNCTQGLRAGGLHMASNMTTGALLSNVVLTPAGPTAPGQVSYDEASTSGYSNAPEKGGFQTGDLVYPVRLVHFFIGPHPRTGRPSLMRAEGRLLADTLSRPFSDVTTTPAQVVQENVEDFQVAFGFDTSGTENPAAYTWQHGLGSTFQTGLRTVRITVVATGRTPRRDSRSATVLSDDKPVTAENHVPTRTTADGLYRSLYTRRVELPNLAAASL